MSTDTVIPSIFSHAYSAWSGTTPAEALAPLIEHHEDGTLIRGYYATCAITRMVGSYSHAELEQLLDLPPGAASLVEIYFETSPDKHAGSKVIRLLRSLKPRANAGTIVHEFLLWLFTHEDHGLLHLVRTYGGRHHAICQMIELLDRSLQGDTITHDEWLEVAENADFYGINPDNEAHSNSELVAQIAAEIAYNIADGDYVFFKAFSSAIYYGLMKPKVMQAKIRELISGAPVPQKAPRQRAVRSNLHIAMA